MPTSDERRRFHRYGFEAMAMLRIGVRGRVPCQLIDLSLNGALVALGEAPTEDLGEGNLGLVLRGVVRGDTVTMSMDIEPVRIEGRRLGCRFVNVDLDSFANLKSLIEDNLGDVSLLDRELTQLDYWPGDSSDD